MLNTIQLTGCVCFTLFFGLNGVSVSAQSPFIDQVPTTNGSSEEEKEVKLEFSTGVRVVMRSSLGVVVRGEMLSISKEGPIVVTDRARLRNPEGVVYKFSTLQSLNIAEHDLHWSKGNETLEFLKEVSESETMVFSNLLEFQASIEEKTNETEGDPAMSEDPKDSTSTSSNNTVIRMQPARKQPIERPTVTIICGNCEKEVSLSSDSGQECPHCHILWDSSPLDAAALANLKAAEQAADAQNAANSFDSETGLYSEPIAMADNEPGASDQNNGFQNNRVQNNANAGLQPVAVPPPIQTQATPQEITLENLPLWMKFAVFGICFAVMYYAIFVR